tara:strand:+ start:920 stop:1174 length:255 start_codon:yes stop_codon:yes gene_type:complete
MNSNKYDELITKLNDEEVSFINELKHKLQNITNYRKNYYNQNKENIKKYQKDYYSKNREEKKEKMLKRYYERKKEKNIINIIDE